jgi:hypothetical protein
METGKHHRAQTLDGQDLAATSRVTASVRSSEAPEGS